jgi:RecB family exonuclease
MSDLDVALREALREETRFIVPSRRDRDWWRTRTASKEFGLSEERRGILWNWGDLYDNLIDFTGLPRLRQIDPPDHRLILAQVVEQFLKEDPEPAKRWPGLKRPGFIDVLSDDIRELINEDISVEQVEAAARDDAPISRVLPALYGNYLEYLRQNRLMDSAQIPQKARELLELCGEDWGRSQVFVFVGFLSFTHAQLALVRRIDAVCREVTLFKPETGLRDFQDASIQFESQFERLSPLQPFSTSPPSGKIAFLSTLDFSLEPEAVARSLALWRGGEGFLAETQTPFPGFGAIAIMTPEQRGPEVESALRRYRIPFTLAQGRSMSDVLPGTLLTPIWTAWVQGLDSWETALILAHPCLAGAGFPLDDAASDGPRGVKGWESWLEYRINASKGVARKNARQALKAFKALVKFCRALEKGAAPEGIFAALHAFLTTPGLWLKAATSAGTFDDPDLDEDLRELAASLAEVEAKRLALHELQPDLGPAGKVTLKGTEAVDFLKNWCSESRVQPGPGIGGSVALHFGPPPTLASYPVWIMTDVTQKHWPGTQPSSPLLDAEERERMRAASAWLPSAHDRRAQREALFRRLLWTGETLTIASCSETDQDKRPAGKTQLLETFLTDMKTWDLMEAPPLGIGELAPSPGKPCFPAIEAPFSKTVERGKPAVRSEAGSPRLSVSDLHELLDCPFRWWLRRAARLNERRTAFSDSAEAGTLTHRLWQNIWRRRGEEADASPSLPVLAAEEWRKALELHEDYAGFTRFLSDRRLKRTLKNLEFYMARLAQTQQDILDRLEASGIRHKILYMEEELSLSAQIDGAVFSGRCDRVEMLDEGQIVILDYKLGKGGTYEKSLPRLTERPWLPPELLEGREAFRFGLQLSAYALMYGRQFPDHRMAGVGFLGHKDGALAGTFATQSLADCYLPRAKPVSPEERIAEAETALRCAAAILREGRYEPFFDAESCSYCDMKGICRKSELRGESQGETSSEMESEDEPETEERNERTEN